MIIYICIIIISIYDDVYGRSAVKTIQIHSPSRLTHSNLEVQHTTTPGHGYLMGDGSHTRKKHRSNEHRISISLSISSSIMANHS